MAPRLVRPNSFRLIFEAATYGDNDACGKSALNCSQRCPRAERMSVFDSNSPRFCFNPRSMASCKDSEMTPGTDFAGTDPVKALPPRVPGKAPPDELASGVFEVDDGVCADALGE